MRKVSQYTLNGEYIKTYRTLKEAADSVGVSSSMLYNAVNGETKYKSHPTCKGYIWKYADENGGNNMLNFTTKNGKNISFTNEEADSAVKFYRVMLSMLDELEKNPRMIPAMKQAMYEAIKEISNAKSKTKEESAEAEENANKTEWKPFMDGFASTSK